VTLQIRRKFYNQRVKPIVSQELLGRRRQIVLADREAIAPSKYPLTE
jgi:hypothetical protein